MVLYSSSLTTSLCFLSTAELPQRSLLNLTRLSHFHSLLHSSKVWFFFFFFCCWEVSFAMGISDLLTDKSHEHFSVPTTFLSNLRQLIASIFLKTFFPLDVLDSLLAVSWVLFFPNMWNMQVSRNLFFLASYFSWRFYLYLWFQLSSTCLWPLNISLNPLICLSNGPWPISTLKCHRHSKVSVSRTKQYTLTLLNETLVPVSVTSLTFYNVHFPQLNQSNLCLISVSSFAYWLHLFCFCYFSFGPLQCMSCLTL